MVVLRLFSWDGEGGLFGLEGAAMAPGDGGSGGGISQPKCC